MFRSPMRVMTLAALGISGASAAYAGQDIPQDQIDRCLKSVNVIGASMGHEQKAGADGRSMLYFSVRSNGQLYTVTCDGATGMVKDVSAVVSGDSDTTTH